VIGSTNPIWVDGDQDGRFSSAREYAVDLVARHGGDMEKLLGALSEYDEAVAVQTASVSTASGVRFESAEIRKALESAAPHVRRGIGSYTATQN
jgi:hypothetical protein